MTSQKFTDLLRTLRQLFLFDRADLDFGLYRIMNARRAEIEDFLQNRLLPSVREHLGAVKEEELRKLEQKVEEAIQLVIEYGGKSRDEAEKSEKVLKAKTALKEASDLSALEDQVYSLLVTFFSRYYDEGDFITKRRYSGPGRERYMIPYDGEEVKLVWANMDQYYIKTDEFLRDYRFRIPPLEDGQPVPKPEEDDRPTILFKLVAADVEKDNRKSTEGDRRFALAVSDENPIELSADKKLLSIPFSHSAHPKGTKQTDLLQQAEENLLQLGEERVARQAELLDTAEEAVLSAIPDSFLSHLRKAVPNKSDPKKTRSLLRLHLDQYAARNTYDYFIHKDLGGFLRRELDYFLKSEVMEIEDMVDQPEEIIRQTLRKTKAVRSIADKIITFLANLEDFQKKLWLKKKFVTEAHYCITLDRIIEHCPELLPEIAANDKQREEWQRLLAIEEIDGYSTPLTEEFLRANDKLLVDTALFPSEIKESILAGMPHLENSTNGLCVQSDNTQGLNLLRPAFRENIRCVYIDPPYNTGSDDFKYKDRYQHSSWISMIGQSLLASKDMMSGSAGGWCNLNDIEDWRFRGILDQLFSPESYVTTVITKCSTASSFRTVNLGPVDISDRIIVFCKDRTNYSFTSQPVAKPVDLQHFSRFIENIDEPCEKWTFGSIKLAVMKELGLKCDDTREGAKFARNRWGKAADAVIEKASEQFAVENAHKVFETKTLQKPSKWLVEHIENSRRNPKHIFRVARDEADPIFLMGGRQFYFLGKGVTTVNGEKTVTEPASTIWTDIDTNNLRHEGAVEFSAGKKPVRLVERIILMGDAATGEYILDFFAGSGTTAHATIKLNRERKRNHKYLLVEQGAYFDTVLRPRIQRVIYSLEWKKGAPVARDTGISHCFKYLRLESYEDTLNNLILRRTEAQQAALDGSDNLKDEYLLGYFLEPESAGSMSLLNIDRFSDPWNYKLNIATKTVGETRPQAVDLVETFNYLIGLKVDHIAARRTVRPDRGMARDEDGQLTVKNFRTASYGDEGSWTFQLVSGETRSGQKTLIIWRTLSGNLEEDNAMLETFLTKLDDSPLKKDWDALYVNGDNTLQNLEIVAPEEGEEAGLPARVFKVRMIEEEFKRRMFAECE